MGLEIKTQKEKKPLTNGQIEPHPREAIDTKTKNPATLQFSTIKKLGHEGPIYSTILAKFYQSEINRKSQSQFHNYSDNHTYQS